MTASRVGRGPRCRPRSPPAGSRGHRRAGGPAPTPTTAAPIPIDRRRRFAPILGWAATVAAAVVLSVVATTVIVGGRVDDQLASQAETISALEEVTTATLAITAQPDAEHVALAGVTDPALAGSLAFSPSTTQLVVVATGLTPPPKGQEYGCWVEVGGNRQRLGRMFFSEDLAYWVGPAPAVSGLSGAATFGVSLVKAADPAASEPVLAGSSDRAQVLWSARASTSPARGWLRRSAASPRGSGFVPRPAVPSARPPVGHRRPASASAAPPASTIASSARSSSMLSGGGASR